MFFIILNLTATLRALTNTLNNFWSCCLINQTKKVHVILQYQVLYLKLNMFLRSNIFVVTTSLLISRCFICQNRTKCLKNNTVTKLTKSSLFQQYKFYKIIKVIEILFIKQQRFWQWWRAKNFCEKSVSYFGNSAVNNFWNCMSLHISVSFQ